MAQGPFTSLKVNHVHHLNCKRISDVFIKELYFRTQRNSVVPVLTELKSPISFRLYLGLGCTKKGDNQEYPSIRIVPPAQYQSLVRGFGFAISKGNDLTGNGYPDVAIGKNFDVR